MIHNMQIYTLQQGKDVTVTAYYEEGGYLQFTLPASKNIEKVKAAARKHADNNFDQRVKRKRYAVPNKKHKHNKPVETKQAPKKYTSKNNPLLRRR